MESSHINCSIDSKGQIVRAMILATVLSVVYPVAANAHLLSTGF